MKNWIFLGIQLVAFDGVGATFEGGDPLYFSRENTHEFVECIDGCLVLSRYESDDVQGERLVVQYGVALREGLFVSVQQCDVTRELRYFASDADLLKKRAASKAPNKMILNVCGKGIVLHWKERMIMLRCEALIGGKKEIFEFDCANFCDLDHWCKRVGNPYKEWFKGSQSLLCDRNFWESVDEFSERRYKELCLERKRAIGFNYSEACLRPLTEEEVAQYFRGIEVIA